MKISILNWFIQYWAPLFWEKSIIKIQFGQPNQIISKEVIIVVCPDLNNWRSWKRHIKIITFVKFWLSCIKLIILLLVIFFFTAFNYQKWIRFREKISLGKIESLQHVNSCSSLNFSFKSGNKVLWKNIVGNKFINFHLSKTTFSHVFFESLFWFRIRHNYFYFFNFLAFLTSFLTLIIIHTWRILFVLSCRH